MGFSFKKTKPGTWVLRPDFIWALILPWVRHGLDTTVKSCSCSTEGQCSKPAPRTFPGLLGQRGHSARRGTRGIWMLSSALPAERDYDGPETDSQRWSAFAPRMDDIVVCTPSKSGTNWVQAILALLLTGDPQVDAAPATQAPWIDMRDEPLEVLLARLEAMTGRRQVKTHTPLDGIPFWSDLRYITVYRHPIDVHFSMRSHVLNMKENPFPGLFPDDPRDSFHQFLDHTVTDATGLKEIVGHFRATYARGERANLLRLHYADLQRDLPGATAQIAGHVGISHPAPLMTELVHSARFATMKANAARVAPLAGWSFWRDDAAFFASGTSNKWEGILMQDDLAAYDARISALLEPEARRWLEWGGQAE